MLWYVRGARCAVVFCFKQKTAYDMRISDWSSDVCSYDLEDEGAQRVEQRQQVLLAVAPAQPAAAVGADDVEQPDQRQGPSTHPGRQIGRASCRERVCQYV